MDLKEINDKIKELENINNTNNKLLAKLQEQKTKLFFKQNKIEDILSKNIDSLNISINDMESEIEDFNIYLQINFKYSLNFDLESICKYNRKENYYTLKLNNENFFVDVDGYTLYFSLIENDFRKIISALKIKISDIENFNQLSGFFNQINKINSIKDKFNLEFA